MPCSLAGNIQAGFFTISELMCVVADFFEAEFATEVGKIIIVGMCQRAGQIAFSLHLPNRSTPGAITFSLRAAKATETLKVEHGW